MKQATLHYIYDPFCGWCYAAAPLVEAAATLPELTIQLHAGGMLAGPNRRQIDLDWRDYVMPHDQRIEALSGQVFGTPYFEGLLRDVTAIMDSAQPIAGILAAEKLNQQGLAMLHRLQIAHYQEGLRISDTPVLIQLAVTMGYDEATFAQALTAIQGAETNAHIESSRTLLNQVGGRGFPTMALERNNGQWLLLPSSQYLGQVDAWKAFLNQNLS